MKLSIIFTGIILACGLVFATTGCNCCPFQHKDGDCTAQCCDCPNCGPACKDNPCCDMCQYANVN